MAIILYSNGITEEFFPIDYVFNEEELLSKLEDYSVIKTVRLTNVLNTWCMHGDNTSSPDDYNKIASVLTNVPIYSHAIFVHDSELNSKWKVSDEILYHSYDEFAMKMQVIIDDTAIKILQEYESDSNYENKVDFLPQLQTVGVTPDKKVLFSFNPDEQTPQFYSHDEFNIFSEKVYNYIVENKQIKEPFTIYADKKAVIIIPTTNVKAFLTKILENFKNNEDYEICNNLVKIIDNWEKKISKPKATRKPRKKINPPEEKINDK